MRKLFKILHTLAACGLIGGLGCYMGLLVWAPHETPAAYADLRQAIAALSNYVLLPSLAVALFTGLLSMIVHHPFQEKGWVWIKAVSGIVMFEGTLAIIGGRARSAAELSRSVAEGEASAAQLEAAIANEWAALIAVMALSVANVVLGVWRPRIMRETQTAS